MYFRLFVPCRNIFLMEHIWRDREILVTGSEVSTGSQKCPHAVKKDELYVPSKFHSQSDHVSRRRSIYTHKKRDLTVWD